LTDWASVDCSAQHTIALKIDGTLWGWGRNSNFGQLGLGDIIDRSSTSQVGALSDWASINSGSSHTMATKTDNTLWTWGRANSGRLGDGQTTDDRSSPVQIGALTDWASVSGGGSHSLAVKTDGTLWAWGSNYQGKLGDGTVTDRNSPVQVGILTDWSSVEAGNGHTVALKTDGTMWAWGKNNIGYLAQGNTIFRSSPVQIGSLTDWASIDVFAHSHALKTV